MQHKKGAAMKYQKSSTSIRIRRFLAIILIMMSFVCLFWPTIINVSWDSRDEYVQRAEEYQKEIKDKSRNDRLVDLKQTFQNTGMSKGDAKKAADSLLTVTEYNTKTGFSFWELRTYFSAYMTYLSVMESNGKAVHSNPSEKDMEQLYFVFGIALNVLFFLLPVLGIGAIVAYFFNRTQAAGYVYAGFALLTAGALAALMIILKERDSDLTAPGVALFLLPLLAIASSIVYRRDREVKNVFTKVETKPNIPVMIDPSNRSASLSFEEAQRSVSSRPSLSRIKWTCTHCKAENPIDSEYCDYCGSPKPAMSVCANCGEQISTDTRFCPYCGAER